MRRNFELGDHLVICERSGQKALRSDCVKQWDGLIVIKEYAEPRHELDRPAPPTLERAVMDARPPGDNDFLSYGQVTRDDL